jgi:hypothetical protein
MKASSSAQYVFLAASCCLFVAYAMTIPWTGPMVALDEESNFRIPMPNTNETCQLVSQPNTSLQLAFVSAGAAFVLGGFCLVYLLSPKRGARWPLEILWAASLLIFVLEMVVFSVLVARIAVWFLSCNNAGKAEGSCPSTRFRQLRKDITDKEQCYFDANTLTVYNAENDQFSSCQETSVLADYNRRFARWDVPAYYSAGALCLRDEPSTNLAWCYYYGCDATCNAETYELNLKWFCLDSLLLLCVLATHLVTFGNLYVVRGGAKKNE